MLLDATHFQQCWCRRPRCLPRNVPPTLRTRQRLMRRGAADVLDSEDSADDGPGKRERVLTPGHWLRSLSMRKFRPWRDSDLGRCTDGQPGGPVSAENDMAAADSGRRLTAG